MKTGKYFTKGSVVKDLESTEKYCAIRELLSRAPVSSSLSNLEQIEKAVLEREKLFTTGLGRGVAIAHGKTAGMGKLLMLLGISRTGIDFQSLDGKPVHFIFLIANSPDQTDEYIRALSTLARVLRSEEFCSRLLQAADPDCMEEIIIHELDSVQHFCN
ncbi:MAG: PTS sugar transporter subunit IIA [Spirochaetaceae bacterium]|nr:MAG: PTS sugar transporter subunit IIA [Spirochaetaceae bacterium]